MQILTETYNSKFSHRSVTLVFHKRGEHLKTKLRTFTSHKCVTKKKNLQGNISRRRRMEKPRRKGAYRDVRGKGRQRGKKDGERKVGEEKEGRGGRIRKLKEEIKSMWAYKRKET